MAESLGDVADVSARPDRVCADTRSGSVLCWGANALHLADSRVRPYRPASIGALEGSVQLVTARDKTCARLRAGTVVCWDGGYLVLSVAPGKPAACDGITDVRERAERLFRTGRLVVETRDAISRGSGSR